MDAQSVRVMQVGGYRPQFRPHRGVIWPVLISGLTA
jgi:hypothetical protein